MSVYSRFSFLQSHFFSLLGCFLEEGAPVARLKGDFNLKTQQNKSNLNVHIGTDYGPQKHDPKYYHIDPTVS